jgi:hypothetical protein
VEQISSKYSKDLSYQNCAGVFLLNDLRFFRKTCSNPSQNCNTNVIYSTSQKPRIFKTCSSVGQRNTLLVNLISGLIIQHVMLNYSSSHLMQRRQECYFLLHGPPKNNMIDGPLSASGRICARRATIKSTCRLISFARPRTG